MRSMEVIFLAAMSSSRSDVVTQFVFPCFRSSPFFSFSVLDVSSCPKEFQWCLVSRGLQGSLKSVSKKFQ